MANSKIKNGPKSNRIKLAIRNTIEIIENYAFVVGKRKRKESSV